MVAAYDTAPVLHGVSLTVEPGAVAAVLGPSGSGKSTLLRVLAGLHRPVSGSVTIGDRLVDDAAATFVPPERRGIGLVPQTGALFPHLTVAGNVGFGLRDSGGGASRPDRAARRQRVADLLELTGLAELARRMPHQLSGGQRQRVALARALAPDPHLVLLDEPFTALDAGLRVSLRAEVLRILRAAGATALLVTHDQAEAMSMASTVALIRDGRIEQAGTPVEVYAAPATPWVGTFLGESTLVPATSDGSTATCALGILRHDAAAAGPVRLLVRPEQVALDGSGVTGTVVAVDFQGHDALVTVQVSDIPVRARVPATALPAVGAEVAVAVRGEVRAFA
nr:ABC transporter ATP-binding protein [Nocardioides thalensis]